LLDTVRALRMPPTVGDMSEERAIARGGPFSRQSIAGDLRRLGLREGAAVLVHSSLSQLGYVAGGAQAVVLALLDVVGNAGTVVMPTHSSDWSDPSQWENPPVPLEWQQVIRDEMPAYDPQLTPTRGMGAIVECFRHVTGTVRSSHPSASFLALGSKAAEIVEGHELSNGFGERSPLGRLYDLDASVLLLGVGHANNTSLHLAEYRSDASKRSISQSAAVAVNGERTWVSWQELEGDTDDFETLGHAFAAARKQQTGPVGAGTAHLMRQRELVDFAANWFGKHRPALE
jgi:aminoglycoside 3-N-acetyltransferase